MLRQFYYLRVIMFVFDCIRVLSKKGATEQYFGFQLATSFASEAFAGIQAALDPNNSRHPSIAEDAAADSGSDTDAAVSPRLISWVDINCGCPTIELSRRGLGATMLQNPPKLQKFVHMLSENLIRTGPASIGGLADMPLTVKIRTGINDETVNCDEVVQRLIDAGVSAVTIHGRTKDQV